LKPYSIAYPVRPAKTIPKSHSFQAWIDGAILVRREPAKNLGADEGIFAVYPPTWRAGLEET
jgi:hypothetical protein